MDDRAKRLISKSLELRQRSEEIRARNNETFEHSRDLLFQAADTITTTDYLFQERDRLLDESRPTPSDEGVRDPEVASWRLDPHHSP